MLRSQVSSIEALGNAPISCWRDVAVNENGQYLIAVTSSFCKTSSHHHMEGLPNLYHGFLYITSNHGKNWTKVMVDDAVHDFTTVSISSNGQHMTAAGQNTFLYYSNNYGQSWSTSSGIPKNFYPSLFSSSSGKEVVVGVSYGRGERVIGGNLVHCENPDPAIAGIWRSHDYGVSFTQDNAAPRIGWAAIACDKDCVTIAAVAHPLSTTDKDNPCGAPDLLDDEGGVYIYRNEWLLSYSVAGALWQGVIISNTGETICASSSTSIYCTYNHGIHWSLTPATNANWIAFKADPTAQYLYAISKSSKGKTALHYSVNAGMRWHKVDPPEYMPPNITAYAPSYSPTNSLSVSFSPSSQSCSPPTLSPSPLPAPASLTLSPYFYSSLVYLSSFLPSFSHVPFSTLSSPSSSSAAASLPFLSHSHTPSLVSLSSVAVSYQGGLAVIGGSPGGLFVFSNPNWGGGMVVRDTVVVFVGLVLVVLGALGGVFWSCKRRKRRGSKGKDERQGEIERIRGIDGRMGRESERLGVNERTTLLEKT